MTGEKSHQLLESLDLKYEQVTKETDLGKKIELTAGMVRDEGHYIHRHCETDDLWKLKTSLMIGGLVTVDLVFSYVIWYIIQRLTGG